MFGNALANAFSVLGVTLAAGFITTKLFHRKSIGGGDIKLLALIAFYLDFGQTVFVVILSCCIGILYALVETAKEGKRLDAFPFAPCICLAAYVVLIC